MAGKEAENQTVQVDASTFEHVFKTQFKNLYAYTYTIVKDEMRLKRSFSRYFFNLWQKKDRFRSIEMYARPHLYKSVHNAALNHLEHLKVRAMLPATLPACAPKRRQLAPQRPGKTKEMESEIQRKHIKNCRRKAYWIFHLSRYED